MCTTYALDHVAVFMKQRVNISLFFPIFEIIYNECIFYYQQNHQTTLKSINCRAQRFRSGFDANLKEPRVRKGKRQGQEAGRVRTSDHTPASHTVMQSWPSQRCAAAGLGPAQSLSRALVRVPLLSCWVHATCLLCIPFPHVREHGVHSVIIHLRAKREARDE